MLDSLEDTKKLRFRYLHEVYKAGQEKYEKEGTDEVNRYEVGKMLNLTRNTVDRIVKYLTDERLVMDFRMPDPDSAYDFNPAESRIAITHEGTKEVENAVDKPNSPTEHFPPASTIINIRESQFTNSPLQMASKDSSQNVTILNQNHTDELKEIVTELKRILRNSDIPDEKKQELKAEVQTIESQSKSPKPKIKIIKDALASARGIVDDLSGIAAASAPLITRIASWLNGVP
jgi:hypothetical protein